MASYNNAEYFDEALESVLAQTYSNWEVIIVDDASTDQTRAVLSKYKDHEQIKVTYRKENRGCGSTKSEAAAYAQGDLAAFLDPDDKLEKNALALMVEAHQQHPQASLVYSLFFACDENLNNPQIPSWIGPLPEGVSNLKANKVSHFASFKTELYKQTTGIDPQLQRAVDKDLYYRLEEVGDTVFIDQPLYHYRIHSGGIASTKGKKIKALRWAFYVKKNAFLRRQQKKLDNISWGDLKKDFRYLQKKELGILLNKRLWLKAAQTLWQFLLPSKKKMMAFGLPE